MADIIDISKLRMNSISGQKNSTLPTRLKEGLIDPLDPVDRKEVVVEHSAEPIKSLDDIERVSKYLVENKRYRDYMLFITGINFGLRVSDLIELRFCDIINSNLTFKDTFAVFEKKTQNTRKQKKNRYITINDAVIQAVTLYLENTDGVKLGDYMFKNQATNHSEENVHISRVSVDRILKGIADDLGLNIRMSTHTLRKTFGYHQMAMCNNDPRKLMLLSKMFGHSSVSITLDYIGITDEEIEDAYRSLNLGASRYDKNGYVCEAMG